MIDEAAIVLTLLLASTLAMGIVFCLSETSRRLQFAFAALVVVGCATAVWCTFFLQYQPSPTLRIHGFPIPLVILQLQNGNWVDFVGGPGLFVDLVGVASLVTMPLSVVLLVRGIRRRNLKRQRGFPILP